MDKRTILCAIASIFIVALIYLYIYRDDIKFLYDKQKHEKEVQLTLVKKSNPSSSNTDSNTDTESKQVRFSLPPEAIPSQKIFDPNTPKLGFDNGVTQMPICGTIFPDLAPKI